MQYVEVVTNWDKCFDVKACISLTPDPSWHQLIAETKSPKKGFTENRVEQDKTDRKRLSFLYSRQHLVVFNNPALMRSRISDSA